MQISSLLFGFRKRLLTGSFVKSQTLKNVLSTFPVIKGEVVSMFDRVWVAFLIEGHLFFSEKVKTRALLIVGNFISFIVAPFAQWCVVVLSISGRILLRPANLGNLVPFG